MRLKNKKIGFVLTGSFSMFKSVKEQIKNIINEGADIIPIMSEISYELDTKYGCANKHIDEIETITRKKILHTINEVEYLGKNNITDIMIILPCSGNTLSKLANGITDNTVTVAVKSHLRNEKPVVIGVSTSDGLSGSAENIGKLLNRSNYYFVPFRQDNPITKPRSLVYDNLSIINTLEYALDKRQIQPILK